MKRILTLWMWCGLFLLALLVLSVSPIAFIYNLFRLFWKRKVGSGLDDLNKEARTVNYTLDVLGNVTVFNWFDHYKDRHQYGISGETVSEVLFYRERENKLTKVDRIIYNSVKFCDKNHFEIFKTTNNEQLF